ncbi:MAG: hypothetical protein ABL962_04285 [Fimbriimonadaceae bacterium]
MDRTALVEIFNQNLEGYDIHKPETILKVSQKVAAQKQDELPYSLLTNLAHANLWQAFWLKKLAGGRKKSSMTEWRDDFRVPEPTEFDALRFEFISGLREAARIAASEPFDHKCSDDQEAIETLVRIAVHGAYHLGQMVLLKRAKK